MSRIVAVAFVLFACPLGAAAQLTIAWEAPATCPTHDTVRAEVVRLLGGQLPEDLTLQARAITSEERGRWTLRLATIADGTEGERVVEADACAPLGDAAALILALMIDPLAVAEHAPEPETPALEPDPASPPSEAPRVAVAQLADPRPGPERATEPSSVTPSTAPSTAAEPSRVVEHTRALTTPGPNRPDGPSEPPEPLHGFIGLGGALDVGSVPDVSGAITVEGGFGIPLIEARLRGTFVFGRDAVGDAREGARITSGMIDARGCVHPFEEARFLYGCVGLGLGLSVAEGFGVSGPEVGVGTFGAVIAGLGVAWSPEPWFDLDVDASLIAAFNRLEFAVRGSPDDVFHTQEPVAGRLGLSLHVRF